MQIQNGPEVTTEKPALEVAPITLACSIFIVWPWTLTLAVEIKLDSFNLNRHLQGHLRVKKSY